MTSRIHDLTLKYDWYIFHGNTNAKRTIQFESTTLRNGSKHEIRDLRKMWGQPRSLTSGDLDDLTDSVQTQL